MTVLDAAVAHADEITGLQLLGVRSARKAWRQVDAARISESWQAQLGNLQPVVEGLQYRAATSGSEYGAAALAEQGLYRAPSAFVDPEGFAGVAPDGRSLDGALYSPATTAKKLIGDGVPAAKALDMAGSRLDMMIRSIVADTSRQAASVDIAARPGIGYVRQLVGTSCRDCVILAGRFYRWNAGFKRHPGDDCIHVPSTQAASSTVVTDPYQHFEAMTEAEQDAFWGRADAQAIRDGSDIYRVYNADRSRRGAAKLTTLEGTTRRRGFAQRGRLTPEGIYRQAGSRAEALQLLEQHGYILPGGQVPGGSIRGTREGFGAMGRGGTRAGARQTVEQARMTGVRTGSRATMTAAEKRLADSAARWDQVRQGRNPYRRDGSDLTPAVAVRVEKDYRRWLRTGGQMFA